MAKRIDFPLNVESGPWQNFPWVQDFVNPLESPITGLTITFTARIKGGGAIVVTKNATIQSPTFYRITLTKTDMTIAPGEYDYDIQITDSGQEDLLNIGRWTVKATVHT